MSEPAVPPLPTSSVRAVRNNNPGNIRIGQPWLGLMPEGLMTPAQKLETSFCVFKSPLWGFRAMAKVLLTYRSRGIKTVAGAINAWAPPSENNTAAYADAVAAAMGVNPVVTVDFTPAMGKAIATHECGGWFFNDSDLQAGWQAIFPPGAY